MTFIWPLALASLILIPVLVIAYLRLQRRRRRILEQFSNLSQYQTASGQRLGFSRHVPALLMLAGLLILFVASARPQAQVTLPRIEGTVILAFDVSGSMAANDIQPTRMEAAKAAARTFVQDQPPGVQIGVVAFSDSGFSVQEPSDDKDTVLASINRLSPQRGTSVASGILMSLKAIQTNNDNSTHYYSNQTPAPAAPTTVAPGQLQSASIVMLTDGENNEQPDPLQAAHTAASQGVRVYTVGLGSPQGTLLHVNGFTVHTQLDEPTLMQIAQITGGTYYNAQSAQDLHNIYDKLDPQLVVKPQKTELTSLFAGASALLLLLGGLLSLLWFSRVP